MVGISWFNVIKETNLSQGLGENIGQLIDWFGQTGRRRWIVHTLLEPDVKTSLKSMCPAGDGGVLEI